MSGTPVSAMVARAGRHLTVAVLVATAEQEAVHGAADGGKGRVHDRRDDREGDDRSERHDASLPEELAGFALGLTVTGAGWLGWHRSWLGFTAGTSGRRGIGGGIGDRDRTGGIDVLGPERAVRRRGHLE